MIGKTISHYKILEKLGEGGMGVVYKAEDTRLGRTVALKFLPPELTRDAEAKQRFVQEARAASALDHPNICNIHDIDETSEGQMFIAMACYEGEPLESKIARGRLKLDEALGIAIQVAHGLAKAHEQKIVHRDIKPGNILVTKDGIVKVVDFGLAKLSGGAKLTRTGSAPGTVSYMSPEQLKGDDVDHRSDIWALGVVLYEMLTGEIPFRGDFEQAISYSIVNEPPRPIRTLRPDVPPELERLIEKTLAKDPGERYQTANELAGALQSLKRAFDSGGGDGGRRDTERIPSIAVLPFRDMSPQGDQGYFCEGMAEELINALTHVEGLRVVARTSAFQFKDRDLDVREIGSRLGVRTVLEGSVRKAGNRVRVTAQLINVSDGYHVWSEKYDREMEDIFSIQDEISLAIVGSLKVRLLGGQKERLLKRYTNNLKAYNLYLQGRWFWNKRTEAGLRKAIECFEEAIETDPRYALAYSGMADAWNSLPSFGSLSPKEAHPRARAAALKALELDDTLAEAHASLGQIKMEYEWDWAGAEAELRRAIELNPAYASAHQWYSALLVDVGRLEEGIEEGRRAVELDPLSLIINLNFAQTLGLSGEHDASIEIARHAIELDPTFPYIHFCMGMFYLAKSMNEQGLAEFQKESELFRGQNPMVNMWIGIAHTRMHETEKTKRVLEEMLQQSNLVYVPAYCVARVYAELGENERSLEYLERAYEDHDMWLHYIGAIKFPEPLRSDPRFKAFLKKMGFKDD